MNNILGNDKNDLLGTLYIIAMPIGHYDDISPRAISTLQEVDLIAAEDTRTSKRMLIEYAITTPLTAYHDHNEQQKTNYLTEQLQQGQSIALISDAGTPLINDPGYRIVKQCHELGIKVSPIPGACAAISALSCAGLPSDCFTYRGFIPNKDVARLNYFQEIKSTGMTTICYESAKRIQASLSIMEQVFGTEHKVCLAKELTKTYEQIVQTTICYLQQWLLAEPKKCQGEMVLVIAPYEQDKEQIPLKAQQLLNYLLPQFALKQAAKIVAETFDLKKNAVYQWGIKQQS